MHEDRRSDNSQRLVIAAGLDAVILSENEVLIQYGTASRPSELHRDADLTNQLGQLFRRLQQGPTTLDDLLEPIPCRDRGEFADLIAAFVDRGFLSDAERDPVEQYLRYTFEGDLSLADGSVLIVGSGPLGAQIASNLLAQGVGVVRLADDRPVTDYWKRSVGFQDAKIGAPANEELARCLGTTSNGGVETVSGSLDGSRTDEALALSDFTVVALERPAVHVSHCINRWAVRSRKPWLHATVDGHTGTVGPLFVPFETACYNDLWTLYFAGSASSAIKRRYYRHLATKVNDDFSGGLPSYHAIVAGFSALAAIHFLIRGTAFAVGRVTTINFDEMVIDTEDVLRLPRCPVCGSAIGGYRPLFAPELAERKSP